MDAKHVVHRRGVSRSALFRSLLASVLVVVATVSSFGITFDWHHHGSTQVPINAAQIIEQCQALHLLPGPSDNFHHRTESDRFSTGTPPTLIRNATIWTGHDSGHEVLVGDILLDKGLIKRVGHVQQSQLDEYKDLVIIDAAGAWVTPG